MLDRSPLLTPELAPSEPGAHGLRRIVRAHMQKAVDALSGSRISDDDVHAARSELKKARANLRMLRPALGKSFFSRENSLLGDAARPLGRVRDSTVLLSTLEKLEDRFGSLDNVLPREVLHRHLSRERQAVRKEVLAGPVLESQIDALRCVQERAARWPVGDAGWSTIGPGLRRVYHKGRKALAAAEPDRTAANLHEWRKQVKYLWHLLETLQPLWPGLIGESADQAHRLADYLGDDHDLSVLRSRIAFDKAVFPEPGSHGPLLMLIDRRHAELRDKAVVLGRRLYQEKPAAFEARFRQYWREWQRRR